MCFPEKIQLQMSFTVQRANLCEKYILLGCYLTLTNLGSHLFSTHISDPPEHFIPQISSADFLPSSPSSSSVQAQASRKLKTFHQLPLREPHFRMQYILKTMELLKLIYTQQSK